MSGGIFSYGTVIGWLNVGSIGGLGNYSYGGSNPNSSYDSGGSGVPTASDADGDGEIDEIVTTGTHFEPEPTVFEVDLGNYNIQLVGFFDSMQDILDQMRCLIFDNTETILDDMGTNIDTFQLTSATRNALTDLKAAAVLFGSDQLSVDGFSLFDLFSGLGDLTVFDNPLTNDFGSYFPDSGSIIVDIGRVQSSTAYSIQGDQFIFETLIHELGHAFDEVRGDDLTPWTVHTDGEFGAPIPESLQTWARNMAYELTDFANENGFDSFTDYMNHLEHSCG